MKILFITDNLGSGGVQRQLVNISNYLAENNEITISDYDNKNNFFKNELSDKIYYLYPSQHPIHLPFFDIYGFQMCQKVKLHPHMAYIFFQLNHSL